LRNRSEAERIGQAGQKLAAKLCGIDAGERAIEGMLDGIVAPVPAKLLFPVYGFCRLAWYVFARLFGLELLTVA